LNKKRLATTIAKSDKHPFQKGNVLYSKLRPYLNKVVIADEDGVCTSEILVFDFRNIDNKYAQYYLMSQYFVDYAMRDAYGVKMPRLGSKQGNAALMPLPPTAEQYRICSKLDVLLGLSSKYQAFSENLKTLDSSLLSKIKQSILQEAIQGKLVPQIASEGTAESLLEEIRAEKERLIKEKKIKRDKLDSVIFKGDDNKYYEKVGKNTICIDDDIPFEIPTSWCWTRMGVIGDWGAGATPQRGNPEYYNGNILWLKTGELNNGIVSDTQEKITEKALQECSLRLNKIGDILIAMYGATIGKLAIVGRELTTNQACCGCTPFFVYNKFLFYFLMANKTEFIKQGEGGAQPNISRIKLVNTLMPLPPLQEQKRIVSQLEDLFKLIK
jgi:type I restriction enzyme S subunit